MATASRTILCNKCIQSAGHINGAILITVGGPDYFQFEQFEHRRHWIGMRGNMDMSSSMVVAAVVVVVVVVAAVVVVVVAAICMRHKTNQTKAVTQLLITYHCVLPCECEFVSFSTLLQCR